jgi:hypothetical protein
VVDLQDRIPAEDLDCIPGRDGAALTRDMKQHDQLRVDSRQIGGGGRSREIGAGATSSHLAAMFAPHRAH